MQYALYERLKAGKKMIQGLPSGKQEAAKRKFKADLRPFATPEHMKALDVSAPAHEGAEASYPQSPETTKLLQRARESRTVREKVKAGLFRGKGQLGQEMKFGRLMASRHGIPRLAGHAGVRPYLAEVPAMYGDPSSFMAMKQMRSLSPIDAAAYAKMKQMGMTPWRPLSQDPKREAQLQQGIRPVTRAAARDVISQERSSRAKKLYKALQRKRASGKGVISRLAKIKMTGLTR
jgi:hypothetical protein